MPYTTFSLKMGGLALLFLISWRRGGVFATQGASFGSVKEDPEVYFLTDDLIRHWGYPVEVHNITTEDGYVLTIFRIPHGRNSYNRPRQRRPVILFQHGLFGSSDSFVCNLPHQDAAFLYADAGYDIWLGNFRGNVYGKRHVRLSPTVDKAEFWDFSWPEMAKNDLPAIIIYITTITDSPYLYYIGHSMGTLTGFVAFSYNKTIARKVKKFYALAPVMKVEKVLGLAKTLSHYRPFINSALYLLGMEQVFPRTSSSTAMGQFCGSYPILSNLFCAVMRYTTHGPSLSVTNFSRIPIYVSHFPAGSSRKTFNHFGQMVRSGKIADFDYGYFTNIRIYGQATPPVYNLSLLETPVGLYFGGMDFLADKLDVLDMLPQLKNIFAKVYLAEFNHVDFVWSLDATEKIFIPIQNDIYADFYA